MLNQLIESNGNNNADKSRGRYLFTTFVLVVGLCFSALVWSLFAKDFKMGSGNLEMSELVAPLVENAPPAPVVKEEKREQPSKAKTEMPTRQANVLRLEESPIVPKTVSVVPNVQKARPKGNFLVSDKIGDVDPQSFSTANQTRGNDENATGISQIHQSAPLENAKKVELPPPPPAIKKPVVEAAQKQKQTVVSGGVINGKATNLPKPAYPASAKLIRAAGEVSVQVLIDENGNVVSAKAVDGHPLLRGVSEKAALGAKFKPTLLSNQPVKVSGVIIYKFAV